MTKVCFISVVRDFDLYNRVIVNNPHLGDAQKVAYDNRAENRPIPARYNEFLDGYDYSKPAWFVFCHEDFEPQEPLAPLLEGLSPAAVYGTIGCKQFWLLGLGVHVNLGIMKECRRDGTGSPWVCGKPWGCKWRPRVDTVDCCCLVVHSSLVEKFHLRFDENLSFDLYVEDFCAAARIEHGIRCRVLPFRSMHHSGSPTTERLYRHLPYLAKKYPRNCFCGTCAYFGTMPPLMRWWRRRRGYPVP